MLFRRMTPDELLTTTRAVRKRLDLERAVERELIEECLRIALQAPSGSNRQGWHFLAVTDESKRKALAELYRRSFEVYRASPVAVHALARADGDHREQMARVADSSEYLAANLQRVPVHLVPCIEGRIEEKYSTRAGASLFGSILPAVWSFMLAARARGLGTAWTTLHLAYEREAAEVLGIPYDRVTQAALVPVAYSRGGSFRRAERKPLESVLHWNEW
jgi:nitroreductase